MRYDIIKVKKSLSPLCFLPSGRLVCYRSGDVLILENENFFYFQKQERENPWALQILVSLA